MNELKDINLDTNHIIDSLNQGIYIVDTDRKILYWGGAAEKITGWAAEDIVGKCCHDDVLCHLDKDGHELCGKEYCPLHRAIITDQSSDVPIIVFAQKKDGSRVPMKVSVAPMKNEAGEIVGGIEIFSDLTSDYQNLKQAQEIQQSILADMPAETDRINFRTHSIPSDIVGGDFYAITKIDENNYWFIMADVMGHGVSAALFTMYLNLLWQDYVTSAETVAELASQINDRLYKLFSENFYFAVATCGKIDLNANTVTIAGAGNPSPLLFHKDGSCETTELPGTPLGMMPNAECAEQTTNFSPGDKLLIFTDGATEIFNTDKQQLETDGLEKILKDMNYPQQKLDFNKLTTKMLKYSNAIRFDDDMSFIEISLK